MRETTYQPHKRKDMTTDIYEHLSADGVKQYCAQVVIRKPIFWGLFNWKEIGYVISVTKGQYQLSEFDIFQDWFENIDDAIAAAETAKADLIQRRLSNKIIHFKKVHP